MKKLLWIGDACCDSGFARATHNTLETLRKTFDVAVLGINCLGDPHAYPYPIYPAWPGKDMFGIGRLTDVLQAEHVRGDNAGPHVIVIQNDPWNIPYYMEKLQYYKIPVVGALAVDGLNCRGGDVDGKTMKEKGLNALDLAIFWTEFGRQEAHKGGYAGPSEVVPLGVDRGIYAPQLREGARQSLGLPIPPGAFLIGNVNRNQPRKRMDLTLRYFANWIKKFEVPDAYLFLHVAPTGESSYELNQLAKYYGLQDCVLLSEPTAYKGLTEESLARLYCAFDLIMSTTQGEGFGLPALEAMACGVPMIAPEWSAYADWAKGAAHLVRCTSTAATFNGINVIGGIADEDLFMLGLDKLYHDQDYRAELERAAYARAKEDRFRWENIGWAFTTALLQHIPSLQEVTV